MFGYGTKTRGQFHLTNGVVPEAEKQTLLVVCKQKYAIFALPVFPFPISCTVYVAEKDQGIIHWKKLPKKSWSIELKELVKEKKKAYRPIWWMWIGLPLLIWAIIAVILEG